MASKAFATCQLFVFVLLALPALLIAGPQAATQVLWLKAGTGIVTDSKNRVSQWQDQSPTQNHAYQTNPLLRPELKQNILNALPAIRFSGNSYLQASPKFPSGSGYTIFVVARVRNFGAYNTLIGGNSGRALFLNYTSMLHSAYNYVPAVSSSRAVPTRFAIMVCKKEDTSLQSSFYIDGKQAGSGKDTSATADNGISIGAVNGVFNFNGDMCEVLIYKGSLSATRMDSVTNYLKDKFQINQPASKDVKLKSFPQHLQFFARDKQDSATVSVSGTVVQKGFDYAVLGIFRNDSLWKVMKYPLKYGSKGADFSLKPKIVAGMYNYNFAFFLKNTLTDTLVAQQEGIVCGDAFIIDGQSNAVYGNVRQTYFNEYNRTFGLNFGSKSPDAADTLWGMANGASNGAYSTGAWGIRLQQWISENYKIPVCIINGGLIGSSIEQHQKDTLKGNNLNSIAGSLAYRIQKAGLAGKIRALFWYQGESNSISGYSGNFRKLYKNWKTDYPSLEKIYLFQIHMGCILSNEHQKLREWQRKAQDSFPDISVMTVTGVPGYDGCHFNNYGYDSIGKRIYRLVAKDLYGSKDIANITPPQVEKIYYRDSLHTVIDILFKEKNAGLYTTKDSSQGKLIFSIKQAFFPDDTNGLIKSVKAFNDTLRLYLNTSYTAKTLTYLPDHFYPNSKIIYNGPWLVNKRNVSAYAFHRFPIENINPHPLTPPAKAILTAEGYCSGKPMSFHDNSKGLIANRIWDFGDSMTSGQKDPTHVYKHPGSYWVTLKVVDILGLTDSARLQVVLNTMPDARFSVDILSGRTVSLKAMDTLQANYIWTLGDSTYTSQKYFKHSFPSDGEYIVGLNVQNSNGCFAERKDTLVVTLTGVYPKENFISDIILIPNPFKDNLRVKGLLPKAGDYLFTIEDLFGRICFVYNLHSPLPGPYDIQLPLRPETLKSGIYFMKINGPEYQKIIRVMKLD